MKKFIPFIILFICNYGNAQTRLSITTDVSLMRNFSPKQKFWAIGQTLQANFHFTEKESIYTAMGYYITGKFENRFIATAKSPTTTPNFFVYNIEGGWRSNQISIGWKHFWYGSFLSERGFNIYTTAGFGLMFSRIENIYSVAIDTTVYDTPAAPLPGQHRFKRLTFDLGLGLEYPIGGTIYAYSDLRTWLPTTHYPSEHLHSTEKVPLPLILSLGFRILFGTDY